MSSPAEAIMTLQRLSGLSKNLSYTQLAFGLNMVRHAPLQPALTLTVGETLLLRLADCLAKFTDIPFLICLYDFTKRPCLEYQLNPDGTPQYPLCYSLADGRWLTVYNGNGPPENPPPALDLKCLAQGALLTPPASLLTYDCYQLLKQLQ